MNIPDPRRIARKPISHSAMKTESPELSVCPKSFGIGIPIVPVSHVSCFPVENVSGVVPLSPPGSQTKPQLIKSVDELCSLSIALHAFNLRYDELQNHLNSIQESINILTEELRGQETAKRAHKDVDNGILNSITAEPPVSFEIPNPDSVIGDVVSKGVSIKTDLEISYEIPIPNLAIGDGVSKGVYGQPELDISSDIPNPISASGDNISKEVSCKPELDISAPSDDATKGVSSKPELETLCESMCGKGVRKYIISNLDKVKKLRQEVPKALSLASKPANLVLEAVGKFFLQGRKSYTKKSPTVSLRKSAILVLELYLMSDCGKEMDDEVKIESESAAVAWRKRLIVEGGIPKASELDARCLLLFIGSFGIPSLFKRDDVISLILLSDPRETSDALKRSCHIFLKISDWIPKMVKCGMRVEAVSVAYIFGLTNMFHPHSILTMHIKESKDLCDRKKKEAQAFPQRVKEATEKHLATLKSIIACLEYHEVDPLKLLPEWQIKQMIAKANKSIADCQKKVEAKASQKRKVEEIESRQKRQRYTVSTETSLRPGQLTGLHDGSSDVPYVDYYDSYDHYDSYDIRRRYVGQYSGRREEILVDKYGQILNPSGQPYGWKVVNAADDDRLAAARVVAEKYAGDCKYSFFGSSSSTEGFPGLRAIPSTAGTTKRSTSDLYQFADPVEGQPQYMSTSQQASAAAFVSPCVLADQHLSYYYK